MVRKLQFVAAAGTRPQQNHDFSEDNVLAFVNSSKKNGVYGLLAVADGMGGHSNGEVASQIAIETFYEELKNFPGARRRGFNPEKAETQLRMAVHKANEAIYQYAQQNPEKAGNLGCTFTCALIYDEYVFVANVGDSRTYLVNGHGLVQVTEDHSYVGEMIRKGRLPADAYYNHPQRNMITRALGVNSTVKVDTWSYVLKPVTNILLCSDGLWEAVPDPADIEKQLHNEPEAAVQRLLEIAARKDGHDDIGVVVGKLLGEQ